MSEFKPSDNLIPLRMYIKATADLEVDVQNDLAVPDPTADQAKAILNESTEGNDGGASSSDDTESSASDSA